MMRKTAMERVIRLLLSIVAVMALAADLITIPVFAADYSFESGGGALSGFGGATGLDEPVSPDPLSENTRRNKDAAYLPPPYGVFSGEIPTDISSPYHNHLPESGFTTVGQDLPPAGGESYAPGSGSAAAGVLPSTSVTAALNTTPWYYEDGSIGTLTIPKLSKTITVYEGESLENMRKGIGHFASTSAWDGNVALAGHNRGAAAYFGFVKNLNVGDTLIYSTKYGTRTYKIFYKEKIAETDTSALNWSGENLLTMITCVENQAALRWAVRARETD
jgi:sortase A